MSTWRCSPAPTTPPTAPTRATAPTTASRPAARARQTPYGPTRPRTKRSRRSRTISPSIETGSTRSRKSPLPDEAIDAPALVRLDGPLLVFGGSYSNLEATTAILAEARRRAIAPSHILCTGDVVAYGADPQPVV